MTDTDTHDETSEPTPDETVEADPIAELQAEMTAGFGKIAEILATQQAQIAHLTEERPSAPDFPPAPGGAAPPPTAAGERVRFFSPHKEYGVWMTTPSHGLVNGHLVHNPGRKLEFSNGLYDTTDPAEVAFLRAHESFGRRFVEDPNARPIAGPTVVEGPKTSGQTARAATPGELAAKL